MMDPRPLLAVATAVATFWLVLAGLVYFALR